MYQAPRYFIQKAANRPPLLFLLRILVPLTINGKTNKYEELSIELWEMRIVPHSLVWERP